MGTCMFKRAHHDRIARLLCRMNARLLDNAGCFFAGGTAIVMSLDEYRESVDIDFVVSSRAGYAAIRDAVATQGLAGLMPDPVALEGNIRMDRDKIQMWLDPEAGKQLPIKLEIVLESRIDVAGEASPWRVPILTHADMYAEKLLANADRWGDKSSASRDVLDLAAMIGHWGDIPEEAWEKTAAVYGNSVYSAFGKAVIRVGDAGYLQRCMTDMQFDVGASGLITTLHRQFLLCASRLPNRDEVFQHLRELRLQAVAAVSKPLQLGASPALLAFLDTQEKCRAVQLPEMNSGQYHGDILWTDGLHAVQALGPHALMVHACRDWFPGPQPGQMMLVTYHHGLSQAVPA